MLRRRGVFQENQNDVFLSGELNNDGTVNAQDLAPVSSNRLRTSLGHGVAGGGMVASVPEPASVIPRRTRRTVPPPLAFPLDKRPWRSEKVFVLARPPVYLGDQSLLFGRGG